MQPSNNQHTELPGEGASTTSTPEFDPFFQGSGGSSSLGGWYSSSAGLIPLDASDGGPGGSNDDFSGSKTLQLGDYGSRTNGNADFPQPALLARKAKPSSGRSLPAGGAVGGGAATPPSAAGKTSPADRGGWVYYDPSGEKDLSGMGDAFSTPRPLQLGDKAPQQGGQKGFGLSGNEDWLRLPDAPHGTFVKEPAGTWGSNKGNDNNYDPRKPGPPPFSIDMTTRNVSPPGSFRDVLRNQTSLGQPEKSGTDQLPPATSGGSGFPMANNFNNPLDFTIRRGLPGSGYGTDSTLQNTNPPGISSGTGSYNSPGLAKYILNNQAKMQQPLGDDESPLPLQSKPVKKKEDKSKGGKNKGKASPQIPPPVPPILQNPFNGPADFNVSNGKDPHQNWNRDIHTTVFGGKYDPNKSAFTGKPIGDTEVGASLPASRDDLRGKWIEVRDRKTGRTQILPILDVGPHYDGTKARPSDKYWESGLRPLAETKWPLGKRGSGNNSAGLDITPETYRRFGYTVVPHRIKGGHEYIIKEGDPVLDWRLVPPPKK